MKPLFSTLVVLAAIGCTKDPAPDSTNTEIIIETGYVECGAPVAGCDGLLTCVEANEAQICVQADAERCSDELTCACAGEWVCGALPCADTDGGFTCGDPPQDQCLRLLPDAIDFGNVAVNEGAERVLQVEAICPADITALELIDNAAGAFAFDPAVAPELPRRLNAGERLDLARIRASHTDPEPVSAAVRINNDPALDVPLQASFIRLIDVEPCLSVQPANLDLGQLILDERVEREITVRSLCGDGEVTVTPQLEPGSAGAISVVGAAMQPITNDAPATFRIAVDSGFETDTIEAQLIVEGLNESVRVPITGEVVRPLIGECLLPDVGALDFGDVMIGERVQRGFQVTSNCMGELQIDIFDDAPPQGRFAVTSAPNVPVGTNDRIDVTVRFEATAPGEARSHVTLGGLGAPLEMPLRANVIEALRCDDPESGCPPEEGIICNAAGDCAYGVDVRISTPPELGEVFLQRWPVAEPFLSVVANGATYDILPTCDACNAAENCGERPDTVQRITPDGRSFFWDSTAWQSDDNDDCARPYTLPDGEYAMVLCYAYEADVELPYSDDDQAMGTIGASLCAPPVPFTLPALDPILIEVPAP